MAFAKSLGATSVHQIEVQQEREETHTNKQRDVAREIAQSLGRAPTAALECSGAESSVRLALKVKLNS